MRILKQSALAAVLACVGAAAQAGACGYAYCWGAVTIGPGGAWGYAVGQANEQTAVNMAAQGCQYNCTDTYTFANACAASAVGNNGYVGWGEAQSRWDAEALAMGYCAQGSGGCGIQVWACSQ